MNEHTSFYIQQESRNNKPDMVDLLNLSHKEKNQLQTAIEKTNGLVHMWVHSHYNEDNRSNRYYKYAEAWRKYEEQRTILIKNRAKMQLPTIALIESEYKDDPHQIAIFKYAGYYASSDSFSKIYYMRTYTNEPTPYIENEEKNRETSWNKVASILTELNVKKIILSGQNYREDILEYRDLLYKDEKTYVLNNPNTQLFNGQILLPVQCVGETLINIVNRGIPVSVSQVTFPGRKTRDLYRK